MQLFSCYVINLEKDKERMLFMEKRLQDLGISFTRLPAVYGKTIDEVTKEKYYDSSLLPKHKGLSPGELGCAISHRMAYENFMNAKEDYTLILEDDVELPDNFKKILNDEILKNTNNSWDYLSFDYFAYGFDFIALWIPGVIRIAQKKQGVLSKVVFSTKLLVKIVPMLLLSLAEELQKNLWRNCAITPIKSTAFAGAYLLTKEGASKLLAVHDKIMYLADRLAPIARRKTRLRFKIYNPLIVRQLKDQFISNLHN